MVLDLDDTIIASASAPGFGPRGIVRITGPQACALGLSCLTPAFDPPRLPRRLAGRLQVDGLRHQPSAALMLWPDRRSFTGQPLAEVHTIGAPVILHQVVSHGLARGARLAGPGEFTMRAFLAGKLDLTRAEAVLAVINAERPEQLDQALRQLAGGLSRPLTLVRDRLMDMLAHLEANLDFADEPDVDEYERVSLANGLEEMGRELGGLANQLSERDRQGARPRVVLAGPPNVGKSRLFNALLGHDHALVSTHAGTTRDYLIETCLCDEVQVDLVDTAGQEAGRDAIDQEAQARRVEQTRQADLVLDCRGGDTVAVGPRYDRPTLAVWTKADRDRRAPEGAIVTSAATGEGIEALRQAIATALTTPPSEGPAIATTAARCRESMRRASEALESAARAAREGLGDEIVALEVRQAIDELGMIVGAIVTDDVLDRVFGRFCIGK